MELSKALQETYVSQGLALGVLAAGREALPARKLDFELARDFLARFDGVGEKSPRTPG